MEPSDVRRRVRQVIDQARKRTAAHRAAADQASRAFETFLPKVATPVFKLFASVIKAEGHPFAVYTPAGGLRLASERAADDYIELALDTALEPPTVVARINRGRGSRLITDERPVREGVTIENLTEEDVLDFLLREIAPFLEK
jgi:hypothetical protein